MWRTCGAACAAVCVLLAAAGCQRYAPAPLELAQVRAGLEARALDIEPVHAFAAALADGGDGTAAAFDASDGLTLREGMAVALWYNADARAARLEAEQAAALAGAAGRWADPVVGLESGAKRVEGGGGGFLQAAGEAARAWVSLASLTITVPLSGRPRLERRLADAGHALALRSAAEAEWRVRAEVRTAWAQWSAAQAQAALLDDHLAVLGRFAAAAAPLAAAGELAPGGARLFAIEQLRLEAEHGRLHAAETEARLGLLGLLGLMPEAPVALRAAMCAEAGGAGDIASHPTLLRLESAYAAAEDRLRLEMRKRVPDLAVTPAFSDEQDESALVLGLDFAAPVWNANREGIAAAAGARARARAEAEAGYLAVALERAQAQAALEGARAQRARLAGGVVPAVDAQLAEAVALLDAGEIDLVLVYEALRQALEAKRALIDAALAEAIAAGRLAASHETGDGAAVDAAPAEGVTE